MPMFKGIIAAIITPFDEDGKLYPHGVKNEIDYLSNMGIPNIFACGSYGAFPVMTTEQRLQLAELVIASAKENKMNVIIQVGSTSTTEAVKLARHAQDNGAAAVSAVVPYYYSTTIYREEDFLRYYEEIVNSVHIPVHIYNNTKTTGFNVSPGFLGRLIDVGLRGIKDGTSDMGRMLEILKMVETKGVDFDYYPSSTSSLITGFLVGALSCISGVVLSVPELVMSIYQSMIEKDMDKAVALYARVMKVRSILGKNSGRAIAAYDVFHAKGVDVGTCKSPWQRLGKDDSKWLVEELKKLEVI